MQSHILSFLCKKILNTLVKIEKVCYNYYGKLKLGGELK